VTSISVTIFPGITTPPCVTRHAPGGEFLSAETEKTAHLHVYSDRDADAAGAFGRLVG